MFGAAGRRDQRFAGHSPNMSEHRSLLESGHRDWPAHFAPIASRSSLCDRFKNEQRWQAMTSIWRFLESPEMHFVRSIFCLCYMHNTHVRSSLYVSNFFLWKSDFLNEKIFESFDNKLYYHCSSIIFFILAALNFNERFFR